MSQITYLTAADAAQILGVTPATVRQMADRGKLPVASTTLGGIRLFELESVEDLARKRARRSEAREAQRQRGRR